MFRTQAQRALASELLALRNRAQVENVLVFDAWGLVWGYATRPEGDDRERLFSQLKRIIEGLEPPLERGSKLDRVFDARVAPMYCVSFAATYVLAFCTTSGTNMFRVRSAANAALPKIEAMTLSLPPPDGDGASSGANHGLA